MAARSNSRKNSSTLFITSFGFASLLFSGLFSGLLSGCSLGLDFSPKEETYFTIVERKSEPPPISTSFPLDVIVRGTRATPFLSGRRIVFGQTTETRGYYQYSSWVEPLPERFGNLLVDALRESQMFRSVAKSSLSARSDIEIVPELVECYHSTAKPPGEARITVDMDVLDARTGKMLGHQRFQKNIASPSYDAAGAVQAMSDGIYSIINDSEAWIGTIASSVAHAPVKSGFDRNIEVKPKVSSN